MATRKKVSSGSRRVETITIDLDDLRAWLRSHLESTNEWRTMSPDAVAARVATAVAIGYPRRVRVNFGR